RGCDGRRTRSRGRGGRAQTIGADSADLRRCCGGGSTVPARRPRGCGVTRIVLSIGSNLGDRMARLQSVVDALGGAVRAVSPVYETKPWGGVEQGPVLNAVRTAAD